MFGFAWSHFFVLRLESLLRAAKILAESQLPDIEFEKLYHAYGRGDTDTAELQAYGRLLTACHMLHIEWQSSAAHPFLNNLRGVVSTLQRIRGKAIRSELTEAQAVEDMLEVLVRCLITLSGSPLPARDSGLSRKIIPCCSAKHSLRCAWSWRRPGQLTTR